MTSGSIPVDLFNPGHVFACLGFLEAADELLGHAEGGFCWLDAQAHFDLNADGNVNPFEAVLDFLAKATLKRCAPAGYVSPPAKKKSKKSKRESESNGNVEEEESLTPSTLVYSASFPSGDLDVTTLPVRLLLKDSDEIELTHWIDGSSRESFKLYAGNRSAFGIARAMIHGTREKPNKGQSLGKVKSLGFESLWATERKRMLADPFGILTRMGGSFNFDPRGGWTPLNLGFSPNEHKYLGVASSPTVEILAAWGLEHARPDEFKTREVRYGVWHGLIPPMLARAALSGVEVIRPFRRFHFTLALSGKNKVVTFATEDLTP
jgi:CRISPR-associated protein Csb3